ncbi:MAG: arsenite methyltransferase [Gammaproteobacteria bacterium]|nr:arsenite methyltransferase [Gammaproteobacteria bacterium]
MTERQNTTRHQTVRAAYAAIARGAGPCCEPAGGCGPGRRSAGDVRYGASYDTPAAADLGLGCGNPLPLAALRSGESVLDLGSGGGRDCLLAARAVGVGGRVIGVDMTPEMVDLARACARDAAVDNVEFRLGEIEHLPLADVSVDVVISNCVINLAADKAAVFREIRRVLKPGGRLAITDTVARAPLPDAVRQNLDLVAGCIGGAITPEEIVGLLKACDFIDIRIEFDPETACKRDGTTGMDFGDLVSAANVTATRHR